MSLKIRSTALHLRAHAGPSECNARNRRDKYKAESFRLGEPNVNQRKIELIAGLFTTIISCSLLAAPSKNTSDQLSVSWQLLENKSEGTFDAELRLHNDGNTALESDWTLYF